MGGDDETHNIQEGFFRSAKLWYAVDVLLIDGLKPHACAGICCILIP
jgi:hypothetical protein